MKVMNKWWVTRTGTRDGGLESQGITSFPRSMSPLITEEQQQYHVPYFKLPISLGGRAAAER